jgi:hypothetical protein
MAQTNGFNFAALIAYSGDFQDELIESYENRLEDIAKGFFFIPGVKNILGMTEVDTEATPKPFDGVFDPVDQIAFIDKLLTVEKYQQDYAVLPGSFQLTHMAAKRKGEKAGNMQIPYEETVYQSAIKAVTSSLIRQTLYHGVGKAAFTDYDAGDAYAVNDLVKYKKANGSTRYWKCKVITTAGQSPETHPAKWTDVSPLAITVGLKKKLDDAVNAVGSTFVPVTTGSLATDAYDKMIAVYRGLPEKVREVGESFWVCCSQDAKDLVMDDYEANYGKYSGRMDEFTVLPKTDGKAKILVCPWLSGTHAVIATVEDCLLLGVDGPDDKEYIDAEKEKYFLNLMISGVMGIGFKHVSGLSINDQALA